MPKICESVAVFDGNDVKWVDVEILLPQWDGEKWVVELSISELGLLQRRIRDISALRCLFMLGKSLAGIFSDFFPGSTFFVGSRQEESKCVFREALHAFGLHGLRYESKR